MSDVQNKDRKSQPVTIVGEASVERRGFIHFEINVPARLFSYQNSNQWNNDVIRALRQKDIAAITTFVANWPDVENDGEDEVCKAHWQITLKEGDTERFYEGCRRVDPVWQHALLLIDAIGGV